MEARLRRNAPTDQLVTPPRFEGAGKRPFFDHRQTVTTDTPCSAATVGTRTSAESGSLSKCANAGLIGESWVAGLVAEVFNEGSKRLWKT